MLPLVNLSLIGILTQFAIASKPIAKINGKEILKDELTKFDNHSLPAIDRLILFHLAIEDARRQGLDQDPALKFEQNKLLYESYLKTSLQKSKNEITPTDNEIRKFYEKHPLIRMRILLLKIQNEAERKNTDKALIEINSALKNKVDFRELVLKFSEDASSNFAGDLGFRGVHQIDPSLYDTSLTLKDGAISPPIRTPKAIFIIQKISEKPYSEISITYSSWIRQELQKNKEKEHLRLLLGQLRNNARIEIYDENK